MIHAEYQERERRNHREEHQGLQPKDRRPKEGQGLAGEKTDELVGRVPQTVTVLVR